MRGLARSMALFGLVGLLVGGWYWLREGAEGKQAVIATTGRRWQSSQDCKSCHAKAWDEWQGSHHRIAYTNPEVRRLSEDFRIKDCQACHLPRPVAETGIGKRTLPRQTRPDEGVGCLACHLAADGSLMGARDNPGVPCRPRRNAEFASVALCESCHNQHQTTDQWRQSAYPAAGKTCITCHMGTHGHAFPGAHDAAMLAAAGELQVAVQGGMLQMTLTNRGAGHNFPTEERHRAVDIEYRFIDAAGHAGAWTRAFRFRQPYRDEPGENTQLPAGSAKTVGAEVPVGMVRAQVRLYYRLNPFAKNDDPASTLLDEKEVPLR